MRANERMDERVAQYLRLDSCLFQTTVHFRLRSTKAPLRLFYGSKAHSPYNTPYSSSTRSDKTPYSVTPFSETPYSETPNSERLYSDTPYSKSVSLETHTPDTPLAETLSTETPFSKRISNEPSRVETPDSDTSSAESLYPGTPFSFSTSLESGSFVPKDKEIPTAITSVTTSTHPRTVSRMIK